jgi:hypothetical protein
MTAENDGTLQGVNQLALRSKYEGYNVIRASFCFIGVTIYII